MTDSLPEDVHNALSVFAAEAVCTCHEAYKSRGMLDPLCRHDLAEFVGVIRDGFLRQQARMRELFVAAEVAQGDVHMLKVAIESDDPKRELLFRATDIERGLRSALAAASLLERKHEWMEGYGVDPYCRHCGVRRTTEE